MNDALKVNYGASGLNIEFFFIFCFSWGLTVLTPNKDDAKK